MTDYTKSADDARRLLRGFKAFAEVADALDAAGTAVQAKADAEKALAKLQVQLVEAQGEIAKAKEQAAGHVEAAKKHAADMVAVASNKAADIVAKATEQAEQIGVAAGDLLAKRSFEAAGAIAERDTALVKRDALVKECEALEKRLANAKAQVTKLLG